MPSIPQSEPEQPTEIIDPTVQEEDELEKELKAANAEPQQEEDTEEEDEEEDEGLFDN